MKDPKNIEDLFKEGLGNYEAPVDPAIWQSIQSSLPQAAGSAGAGGAAAGTGMSVTKMVVIGTIAAASIGVGVGLYNMSQDEEPTKTEETTPQEIVEVTQPVQETDIEQQGSSDQGTASMDIEETPETDPVVIGGGENPLTDPTTNPDPLPSFGGNAGNPGLGNGNAEPSGNSGNPGQAQGEPEGQGTPAGDQNPKPEASTPKKVSLAVILSKTEGEAPLTSDMVADSEEGNTITWTVMHPNGYIEEIGTGNSLDYTFQKPGDYLVETIAEDPKGKNKKTKQTLVTVMLPENANNVVFNILNRQDPRDNSIVLRPGGFGDENKLKFEYELNDDDTFSMFIMNGRTGKVVYISDNPELGWDCTYNQGDRKGETVEQGSYFYVITIKDVNAVDLIKPIKRRIDIR